MSSMIHTHFSKYKNRVYFTNIFYVRKLQIVLLEVLLAKIIIY